MGENVEATGTPLYIGADEPIVLEDLRRATRVVARTLLDLLKA